MGFNSGFKVLTKEDLQHMTALSEPGDDSETNVKRPQLTTSALKKGLQMAADLVNYFFEFDHFMDGV